MGGTGGSSGGDDGGTGMPPWHCQPSDDGDVSVDCQGPPTCDPGSHPAPCGACVPDGSGGDCVPPGEGGCWVTGGGFIVDMQGAKDNFGGNAMPMKDGTIRGEWENINHATGDDTHGQAQYLVCRTVPGAGPGHPNGPQHNFTTNQAYFGGPASWNGTDGYWFDVMVEDHGEPGRSDVYHVTVRKGPGGAVVFDEEGTLAGGGNIQLHPPNNGHPGAQSSLPAWVSLQP
jgi:hypothetical protein